MLKIFKNKYVPFLRRKDKQWKYYKIFSISFKLNKKSLLLLIPENTGDRVFSMRKTEMPTEYTEKGIKCFKN